MSAAASNEYASMRGPQHRHILHTTGGHHRANDEPERCRGGADKRERDAENHVVDVEAGEAE